MKNVDRKKLMGTIVGGLAFILCMIFFTYAWYVWRSGNTILSGEITDESGVSLLLENDGNIETDNIGPVLNPEDGVVVGFSADNRVNEIKHLYIDLKINSIDSELLNENFKYIIVKSTVSPRTDDEIDKSLLTYDYNNPVASGNFSNFTVSTNLLGEDNILGETITFYKVIIYLDGNVQNNINMQGKSIDAMLIITDTNVKFLNEVPVGSYVEYTGNNGCVGDACSGQNANYESGVTNGYCNGSTNEFTSSGWRVAYIENGNAHIVTAGAPECLCTNSDGTTSNSSCSSYETTIGAPQHIANLNNTALKYCNSTYAKGEVCNDKTAWAMKESDFTKITGSSSLKSCSGNSSAACGLGNDLIDNRGYYWFATPYNSASSRSVFSWSPNSRDVYNGNSHFVNGVRPVLRLESSVIITGGEGTEESPYKIALAGVNAANHIKNLYNDGSSINSVYIADDNTKPQVHLNATQSIMLDNNGEYRYYGANSKNYVSFNGELWRIISVSKVFSSESDTTGETRVRIIKDSSIGYYSWDSDDYSNNWTTSTLMTTLNNPYYNRTTGTCYKSEKVGPSSPASECDYANGEVKGLSSEARNLISDALWYLGGGSNPNLYADDFYNMERNNAGYGNNPTRWTGSVGILYPSDYMYAADLSVCKYPGYDTTNLVGYSDSNCYETDWLYNNGSWMLYSYSGNSNTVWYLENFPRYDVNNIGYTFSVKPVVVLKSNVLITGGDGSSTNPYTLAINK